MTNMSDKKIKNYKKKITDNIILIKIHKYFFQRISTDVSGCRRMNFKIF